MADQLVSLGPWRGCVTSREKVALKTDELGPDSTNWQVSPEDGRIMRRGGAAIQITTVSSGVEVGGVLETTSANPPSTYDPRARQFVALHSPSVTDGYETPAWLVGGELWTAGTPTNATGTLAWISRNDNSFYQLGLEFGVGSTNHYRQDGTAGGQVRMKIVPYVMKVTNDYGRLNSAAIRSRVFAGSRRVMELDSGVYSPGQLSCPYWWNKRYNDSATSGTEVLRARPWGLDPPLWAPTTTTPSTTTTGYQWQQGDTFWEAWAFKFKDGSIGPPFRVSTSATTPARGGLITLGVVPGTTKYPFRRISDIPIGPKGPVECIGRVGFRSPKVNRAATTDINPDPTTLYPFCQINDNTTSTYDDYAGNDDNLTALGQAFFDQTWPPRADGAVAIDGRTVLWGNIRPNPYALILAPTGTTASRDRNVDDESTGTGNEQPYGAIYYHVRITATDMYLKKTTQGAPNTTSTLTLPFSTYTTLQSLVDKINESVVGDAGGEWSAQLVPGVDGATKTTVFNPANTASPFVTLRATTDCGDEGDANGDTAPGDATTLNVRAYCPQYPFVAAFSENYLSQFPTDVAVLYLSVGVAGLNDGVYSQFRYGATAPGQRKTPSGHAVGRCMGVEPCTGPNGVVALVFYERARYALRNTKSGGSRDNVDYHLVPLDSINGAVSYASCFSGPGFSGCVGLDGVWVSNGEPGAGLVLSRDHLDEFPSPGQLEGDLAYAVRTDAALAATGNDGFTWAGVLGDKIRLRYRKQNVYYTENGTDYWFGRGERANGLACLYKPDGSLYGWSCPNRNQKVGVHGVITDSTGKRVFAWQDTNQGSTDGRVDEVDMNATPDDNGTDFASSAFTASVLAGPFEEIGIKKIDATWRNAASSTIQLIPYVDVERSETVDALTLDASGSSVMRRRTFIPAANAMAHKQAIEFKILDDGSGNGAVEVRNLAVMVNVTKAETRYA